MTPPAPEADLFPPRYATAAAGLPTTTYQTLHRRGQLGRAFFGGTTPSGRRLFTRRGVLALALYRRITERGGEIRELSPESCIRWADLWLRTRDAAKPIRELWVRYYGRPGEADDKISLLPNADVLTSQPAPGAVVTIVFDLDQIFGAAEAVLRDAPDARRDPVDVFDLPDDEI